MGTATILLVCCALAGAAAGQGMTCSLDEFGTHGDCRHITRCPELLRKAQNARPNTPSVAQLRERVSKCPQTSPSKVQICCKSKPRLEVDNCKPLVNMRVISGDNASIGEFPFLVSIQIHTGASQKHRCGGTLITSRHVLTAAHCVRGLRKNEEVREVILGELNFNTVMDCDPDMDPPCADPPITVAIDRTFVHDEFQGSRHVRFPKDIAVLKLAKEVPFTPPYIQPVCLLMNLTKLQKGRTDNAPGLNATVAGWGSSVIGSDQFTPILQTAKVPIQNISMCQGGLPLEGRICAGNAPNNSDTCRGDSGGPLMLYNQYGSEWYQAGISSFGTPQCGETSGYTRVLDYVEWIAEQITK